MLQNNNNINKIKQSKKKGGEGLKSLLSGVHPPKKNAGSAPVWTNLRLDHLLKMAKNLLIVKL